jgi:hypothetical protein
MAPSASVVAGRGLLLDSSLLQSPVLAVLNAFVVINTVMFLALAILKLMPKVYVSDWVTSRNRRAETRGIHPDPPPTTSAVTPAAPDAPPDADEAPTGDASPLVPIAVRSPRHRRPSDRGMRVRHEAPVVPRHQQDSPVTASNGPPRA